VPQTPIYFLILGVVGILAAIAMAIRAKSQGPRLYVMALAFLAFAGINGSVYFGLPNAATYTIGGILVVLLLVDVVLKSSARNR